MRKQLDFYGYNSPTSGRYYIDDEVYTLGEDYRTVKRYKEYRNVGFNILLLQHENSYSGEEFVSSVCKMCMDRAYKAGLDRVIVSDNRLKDLCEEKVLVGENGRFASEEELLQYVDEYTLPYRTHPAFYGVQLFDEPQVWKLKSYAAVYRALKKVDPKIEAQCNLLNLCAPSLLAETPTTPEKDYEAYLNFFADESGIDYLMTDEYAFRRNNVVSNYTLPTFQILAKVCKERNIEFRMVLQSFTQEGNVLDPKTGLMDGGVSWRRVTEKDMYWQINLAAGFGCREYSFFTYFTKQRRSYKGTRCVGASVDGAAFINYDGSRTKLYYYTRRIIAEIKKMESLLLKYAFKDAYFFFPKGKTAKDFTQTERAFEKDGCPIQVKTQKRPVIVTEQVNGSDRLFMVENIGNPTDETLHGERATEVEIDLGKYADNAKFYYRGERVEKTPVESKIKLKMHCGEALFIEICNA